MFGILTVFSSLAQQASNLNLPTEDQDPSVENRGYLESLITKIKDNIKVEVYNLIIKYQEPQFVMRTTIGSLELTTADEFWKPAFIDRSQEAELALRQICKVTNLTMNIDTRDPTTGLIDEAFPDPFLSKTQIETRIQYVLECQFPLRFHR